jgi:hypothetical protein
MCEQIIQCSLSAEDLHIFICLALNLIYDDQIWINNEYSSWVLFVTVSATIYGDIDMKYNISQAKNRCFLVR